MEKRSNYIDILKGIGIILVVTGHFIQFGFGDNYLNQKLYQNNIVFQIIYSFHMPLFLLISGYLFANTIKKYQNKNIIKNKTTTLLIPAIAWAIIRIILRLALDISKSQIDSPLSYLNIVINSNWFLWAIYAYVLIIVLIKSKIKNNNVLMFILVFILFMITPNIGFTSTIKYNYPFFIIGYLYNNSKNKKLSELAKSNLIYLIVFITYIIGMLSFKKLYYIDYFNILKSDNIGNYLICYTYKYLIGIIGTLLLMITVKKVHTITAKLKIWNIIENIGKNTIGIYLISGILFDILSAILTSAQPSIAYGIIGTFIMLIISYYATIVLKKIPLFNKLLLGIKK